MNALPRRSWSLQPLLEGGTDKLKHLKSCITKFRKKVRQGVLDVNFLMTVVIQPQIFLISKNNNKKQQ